MNAQSILRECLESTKTTQRELAKIMNVEERLISQRLTRTKDIKVGWLINVLECLGFSFKIYKLGYIKVTPTYYRKNKDEIKKSKKKIYCHLCNGLFLAFDGNYEKVFKSKKEALRWLKNEGEK